MKSNKRLMAMCMVMIQWFASTLFAQQHDTLMQEPHRPQFHFSPQTHWMNDPNGMVYYKGIYHLFFQYYPDSSVWGPMHWGHATSKDLIHWKHQPVALYPDSLGYIFSGSAVVDANNTSGFGKNGIVPLVAIFTHHNPKTEKTTNTFQNQSIAYSLNEGKTWTKYVGNPVLKNPGIVDFRDPKVMWYEPQKKWIMTLATKDRVTFYSSKNLKNWSKESEFGITQGAHGGVWECPDLFPMECEGKQVWVLVVNINPGGPNKGSASQYFVGDFDGNTFSAYSTETKWIDYGTDNYAGITWSNTGRRKIFLGWMSNWQYATVVPTEKWRSAITIPRELGIEKIGSGFLLTSQPVKELNAIAQNSKTLKNVQAENFDLSGKVGTFKGLAKIHVIAKKKESFSMVLSNGLGEKVVVGYDKANNEYYIDRTQSGKHDFEKGFAEKHVAPVFGNDEGLNITFVVDKASVEMFADKGLTVMTDIFFPNKPYDKLSLQSPDGLVFDTVDYADLKSIWKSPNP